MFGMDAVEPPENLYQEGNTISKYSNQERKRRERQKRRQEEKTKENKSHKYQKDTLGNFVDIEV